MAAKKKTKRLRAQVAGLACDCVSCRAAAASPNVMASPNTPPDPPDLLELREIRKALANIERTLYGLKATVDRNAVR